MQLARGGSAEAAESSDGRFLYYVKVPEAGAGLWSILVQSGDERRERYDFATRSVTQP